MMNGCPAGKGCMDWSDGRQEVGQVRARGGHLVLPTFASNAAAAHILCHATQGVLQPPTAPTLHSPTLQFDGSNCHLRLGQEEVAGTLMVAADNARDARAAAGEAQQEAQRQQEHIAAEAARLFAAVAGQRPEGRAP